MPVPTLHNALHCCILSHRASSQAQRIAFAMFTPAGLSSWDVRLQEKRHQMMNDVRALCSVSDPNLVQLIGAYHAPEKGQVRPAGCTFPLHALLTGQTTGWGMRRALMLCQCPFTWLHLSDHEEMKQLCTPQSLYQSVRLDSADL